MKDPQDRPKSKAEVGPDGILRSAQAHARINEALASLFRPPLGGEVLAYLRSISINAVCGPEVTDAGLRHREGMRHLVTIIEQRIEAHHREQLRKPDAAVSDQRAAERAARRAERALTGDI